MRHATQHDWDPADTVVIEHESKLSCVDAS